MFMKSAFAVYHARALGDCSTIVKENAEETEYLRKQNSTRNLKT